MYRSAFFPPRGYWVFKTLPEGLLYYPHGWGQAYLVPSADKRREIEQFLDVWLARLRFLVLATPACAAFCVVLMLAFLGPAGLVAAVLSGSALVTVFNWLIGVSVFVNPLLAMFLAETVKADLEKASVRRPLALALADGTFESNLRILRTQWIFSSLVLLWGIWMLWPRTESVIVPARVDPRFLASGLFLTALGAVGALTRTCLIATKLRSYTLRPIPPRA